MNGNIKILLLWICAHNVLFAQSNFSLSNPDVVHLLQGNFPVDSFNKRLLYADSSLVLKITQLVSADSLFSHLSGIVSFQNRNTLSDHPGEPGKGIRGARNWIQDRILQWAARPQTSVIPCELEFDYAMCQKLRHTELFAVIPGTGIHRDELVIIESHLDSRCEDVCDTTCLAQGADDNGSGSALIMEAARILSQINMDRTVVLLWCTGEEQGLGGSKAFANYCSQNGIKIKAVFNNDIVGGIECGKTSSPPSCPGPMTFDSLRFRVFSAGLSNSMPKNLARLTKILVEENVVPVYPSAPKIDVMFGEDRSGRGGDHIPFRELGYTSIRFTSSYENGDGNPSQPGYSDRQHSTRDILGKDLNGDGILDSLYVHFPYLRNNTIVNLVSVANAGSTVLSPFQLQISALPGTIKAVVQNPQNASAFIFGLRKINSAGFDTVLFSNSPAIEITGLSPTQYYITAAGVERWGWISMFGQEYNIRVPTQTQNEDFLAPVELVQNNPNPFDELTMIPIVVHDLAYVADAMLRIHDESGHQIYEEKLYLQEGINELYFNASFHAFSKGPLMYSLWLDHKLFASRKMLLLNY